MNRFLLPFLSIAAASGCAIVLYALLSPRTRWRRLVGGSSLLALCLPAWLFAHGGFWATGRSYLLLVPPGSEPGAKELIDRAVALGQ